MTFGTLSNPSRFVRFPDLSAENFPVITNTVALMIKDGVDPKSLRSKPVDPISVSLACGKVNPILIVVILNNVRFFDAVFEFFDIFFLC